MSFSRKNFCRPLGLLSLVIQLGTSACDPCRQLAEQICHCRYEVESEKQKCLSDLSLAGQHTYFKNARNQEACEIALEKCTCEQINNDDDVKCGYHRFRSSETAGK